MWKKVNEILFKKIGLCIFSTVLFTAISAGLYTWSTEFLSYIGKSHITHVPSLLLVIPFHALLQPAVLPRSLTLARSASNILDVLKSQGMIASNCNVQSLGEDEFYLRYTGGGVIV